MLSRMSTPTATSKGAATRDAILDRAYEIARQTGLEGLSIGTMKNRPVKVGKSPPSKSP